MNVTFEEGPMRAPSAQRAKGLAGWLINKHIVSTGTQAQVLMFAFAVVLFIVSFTIIRFAVGSGTIDTQKNFVPAVVAR